MNSLKSSPDEPARGDASSLEANGHDRAAPREHPIPREGAVGGACEPKQRAGALEVAKLGGGVERDFGATAPTYNEVKASVGPDEGFQHPVRVWQPRVLAQARGDQHRPARREVFVAELRVVGEHAPDPSHDFRVAILGAAASLDRLPRLEVALEERLPRLVVRLRALEVRVTEQDPVGVEVEVHRIILALPQLDRGPHGDAGAFALVHSKVRRGELAAP
mmetsp:Transcript_39495/g.123565  ORF Transcript_39495/g.123565 Transcript_39495/m.123565 type:complete len:220 (-) Transcript_39495:69-728(-)